MKIMVTGATGFVGSHCVRAFIDAGHEVKLLVRSPERMKAVFAPNGITIDDWVRGDMTDAAAVSRALDGCDAVLHAAATFYGGPEVLEANIQGVRNVIGGAAERGLDPILYVSSIGSMFPGEGEVMTAWDPIASFDTMYGQSKAEGERFLRELQEQGAPATMLYPAGVFGPDDPVLGETSKGLRDSISVLLPVTQGGIAIVDVRDVAEAATRSLSPGRGPRRYMMGGHYLRWHEYAEVCSEVTGRQVRRLRIPASMMLGVGSMLDTVRRVVPFQYPLTREAAQYMVHLKPCDSRPALDELGFEFRPIEQTLSDAIRWLHQAGHVRSKHAGRLAE